MTEKIIEVTFEKIGHNGVSVGQKDGKVVFAYGVLPGEIAKIKVWKDKKNFCEGEVLEIIKPSSLRREPKEDHYLSCSPWQVFDYQFQIETKRLLLEEIFQKFAKENVQVKEFLPSPLIFGYRTKIEFSFYKEKDNIFLAFHKRGTFKAKVKAEKGCCLIDKKTNEVALAITNILKSKKFFNVKSLVLRKSHSCDKVFAILFVTEEKIPFKKEDFEKIPVAGFSIYFSEKNKSASTPDKLLFFTGEQEIEEKILDKKFLYYPLSFFQNNIFLFEQAILRMKEHFDSAFKVLDLFCGVGVIGLLLADRAEKIVGVEVDEKAIQYALKNAELNKVGSFQAFCLPSEKINLELLRKTNVLVVDPPRAGLHKKLIEKILQKPPQTIFYLSCNPITQARDFSLLKEKFQVKALYGFDFYPNTPHIESLLVLKKT